MKEVKMNKNRIFAIYHKELIDNWYQKWTSDIRKKLPANFVVTDAEIDSEITYQCQYLASIFRGGHYPAFCNSYVTKRAVAEFWHEYKLLDHSVIADSYAEFDDDYNNAYQTSHQYGEYDVGSYTTIDDEIENNDMMENINNMTKDNIDRTIIMLILEGLTYDEIALKLNISKGTIAKRMKAIGDKIKEKENA